ncbi:MAG: polyprenol monophosphomannose synthase [Actinomycetaceae bacterium]|nr:polyprenol monophosphomannose synthase [Actinomycetaceae bacterium]
MTMNISVPTLVVIPTYNELQNLPGLLGALFTHLPQVHVLVVDDSSPDGTGQWVEKRANDQIHLMQRPAKSGLASAYLDGFAWGLERGYEYFIQMDADGSHRVVDLTRLIERAQQSDKPDLVIGSRWVPNGGTQGWGAHRIALSRLGNAYIQALLRLGVADATAGFRVYRHPILRELVDSGEVQSRGYGFQVEMTWRAARRGARIVEVPIVFLERRAGESKMDGDIIKEELINVTKWGLWQRKEKVKSILCGATGE